jgi:preprotein translocase subunit SecE
MARQGADPTAPGGGRSGGRGRSQSGRAGRAPAQPQSERVGPKQYLAEVRGEMRKVAWPTRNEVINSSLVVLVAVSFATALIFGYDFLSAKFVLFLFD